MPAMAGFMPSLLLLASLATRMVALDVGVMRILAATAISGHTPSLLASLAARLVALDVGVMRVLTATRVAGLVPSPAVSATGRGRGPAWAENADGGADDDGGLGVDRPFRFEAESGSGTRGKAKKRRGEARGEERGRERRSNDRRESRVARRVLPLERRGGPASEDDERREELT
ncbi:hypothetical protein ACHAWF_013003, partial [Thalassiosira exigua]